MKYAANALVSSVFPTPVGPEKIKLAIGQSDELKLSQPVVNEEDIAHIVASWTGVPVQKLTESESVKPVSYTHLTLPTICSV